MRREGLTLDEALRQAPALDEGEPEGERIEE
jgi:hypothetical protein